MNARHLRNVIVCFFIIFTTCNIRAQILFNEVMQSNVQCIIDETNNYPDGWIELYNTSDQELDLQNFSIGCNGSFCQIQCPCIIKPNGYCVFFTDKKIRPEHLGIKLEIEDTCKLSLYSPNGYKIDSLYIPPFVRSNISYGRVPQSGQCGYFHMPTPGGKNDTIWSVDVLKEPTFSFNGGLFQEGNTFWVKVNRRKSWPEDVVVRYTLDGSWPDENSPIFQDSILIDKTTIIRAASFSKFKASSEVTTASYIFEKRDFSLPVVSIVTDNKMLYDDNLGILCDGTYYLNHKHNPSPLQQIGWSNNYNFEYSWKRPANIECFDNGSSELNQLCDIKVHGASTRRWPIKSLSVKADKKFGKKHLAKSFWSEKNSVKKSKSIILRNAGQDIIKFGFGGAFFRDAFAQQSVGRYVDLDWQACKPVIAYLNGSYYGILNLREKADEDYVWANYSKLEEIDLIEDNDVKKGDIIEYNHLMNLCKSDTVTYTTLKKEIDIEEFSNYLFVNLLFSNVDFPGNNQVLWKSKDGQHKWRWIAKDMDFSTGYWKSRPELPYLNYLCQENPPKVKGWSSVTEESTRIFRTLLQNNEFKEYFIDLAAVYLSTFASANSLIHGIDSMMMNIEYEMPYFTDKYNHDINDWYDEINWMRSWTNRRITYLFNHFSEFYHLSTPVPLKIYSDTLLFFNNIKINEGAYDGSYYGYRNIHLSTNYDSVFNNYQYQKKQTDSPVIESSGVLLNNVFSLSESNVSKAKWTIMYSINDSIVVKYFDTENLDWQLPPQASSVTITRDNKCNELYSNYFDTFNAVFTVYDFSGRKIMKGTYKDVCAALEKGKLYIIRARNNHGDKSFKIRY